MNERELSIEELLADVADLLEETPPGVPPAQAEQVMPEPKPESRAGKQEKKEKSKKEKKDKPVKAEKTEKPVKAEKTEKPVKTEKAEKPVKTEKAEKPAKPEKKEKPKKVKKKQASAAEKKADMPSKAPRRGFLGRFFTFLAKLMLFLLETVLLLVIGLYGLMFVLAKGPSDTARDLFVLSVRETDRLGWVANIYFTQEEIARIENRTEGEVHAETDTSLIRIPEEKDNTLTLEAVQGEGYRGHILVVTDPSRLILGSVPQSYGIQGYTIAEMAQHFDAVAAINAGSYYDPDGTGNGSIPDSLVVFEGNIHYAGFGTDRGFAGFDSSHILHVASDITEERILEKDIRYGICAGPVLIANGEPCELSPTGIHARTAIGQRADGAIVLLVIDGYQPDSLGATLEDVTRIMLDYGAVNACSLQGGSSSGMWYEGDYVSSIPAIGEQHTSPTAILVLKEGGRSNG